MDMCEVTFSRLTKGDTAKINAVQKAFSLEPAGLQAFVSQPQNLAFTAQKGGEVVGFIYGYSLMALKGGPQLFIYSVDVLPQAQNRGIGSGFFQFVVDYSRENGFAECFVITDKANKKACRIYEKAGGQNDYEDEIVYVIKHDENEDGA